MNHEVETTVAEPSGFCLSPEADRVELLPDVAVPGDGQIQMQKEETSQSGTPEAPNGLDSSNVSVLEAAFFSDARPVISCGHE